MSKDGLQDFHDDDDDEFGASFRCNGGQCPGNGQDTDSMATILNWTVKTVMKMRAVVMFDTMTIGLPSAIMSEGQFTLTDDTRRAATRQQPPIWYRWIARDCDDQESDAGNDDGRPDDNDHNVNDNEGSLLWLIIPGAARAFYLA